MTSKTTEPPVWFITGCSKGFGREFVRAALAHGFRVAATARDPKKLVDLIAGHEDTAIAIALDITKANQIERAVAEAERAFGRIDVLVNNAGYGYLAAIEEGEEKEIHAIFDTNFFGAVAVTKAVLPGMRARGHGFIVNIASVGGVTGHAGSGYYSATKFALEGMSEALAQEVEPLGIHVLIVEPGPFRTNFGLSVKQSSTVIGDYEKSAGKHRRETIERSGKQPGDPARAAEAVIAALQSPTPPHHLVLGRAGFENVENQLRALLQEADLWKATSLGADYPPA